jgi:predicted ATPase
LLTPEKLYQILAPGLPSDFPPLKSEPHLSHNLPLELTSFIGRQTEIKQVQELLRKHRIVTITGSGGVGKTRLSLQVAERVLPEIPDGIWYVELASISDPELVPQSVSAALGLREEPNLPVMGILENFLSAREILLILDNCEHLLEACALIANTLLRKAARLKILASSREALGIDGEIAYRVPSMATPEPRHLSNLEVFKDYEAVRLFTERARVVLPGFEVTEHNAHAIAQICKRLDGIPLALELAAARINLLTTEQVANRLDDAFRLLSGGSRMTLPRHQTLRATIDWSYSLLSTAERVLLRRLAVFTGGSTLETIEAICSGDGLESDQVLTMLTGLVNKSMISVERKQGQDTRYRLFETVHQFAQEKLYEAGESQTFRDRHVNYFLDMAEGIEPQLRTPVALECLRVLDREMDNLRAALSWAFNEPRSQNVEIGLQLAQALFWFWFIRNHMSEGRAWYEGLLLQRDVAGRKLTRAKILYYMGSLALKQGDDQTAMEQLDESIAIFREAGQEGKQGLAYSLITQGELHHWNQLTPNPPILLFQESLTLFQELGDKWGQAIALHWLGVTMAADRAAAGRSYFKKSLDLFRELGDRWAQTMPLGGLGSVELALGNHAQGRALFEESLSIQQEFGDKFGVSWTLVQLGNEALNSGEIERANDYCQQALDIRRAAGDRRNPSFILEPLNSIAQLQGDYEKAHAFLMEMLETEQEERDPWGIALSLRELAIVAFHMGNHTRAADQILECLPMLLEVGNLYGVATCLILSAELAMEKAEPLGAARLLGAAETILEGVDTPLRLHHRADYERAITRLRTQLDKTTLESARNEGRMLTPEGAIAFALREGNNL